MKRTILALAVMAALPAHADVYVGVGGAVSQLRTEGQQGCAACDGYQFSTRSLQPALSIEARSNVAGLGLMLSYGRADREADNHAGARYYALKGDASGAGLDAHVRQSIQAHWIGLQATQTVQLGAVGLRAMIGLARVTGHNYERGTYDYGTANGGNGAYWVDHRNDTLETRPLYGLGAEYTLSPHWLARLEWQHMDKAVHSHWTLESRIDSVGLQAVYKF